jgi:hypothetical protein
MLKFNDRFGDVVINRKFKVSRSITAKYSTTLCDLYTKFPHDLMFEMDVLDEDLFAIVLNYMYERRSLYFFDKDSYPIIDWTLHGDQLNITKMSSFFQIIGKFDINLEIGFIENPILSDEHLKMYARLASSILLHSHATSISLVSFLLTFIEKYEHLLDNEKLRKIVEKSKTYTVNIPHKLLMRYNVC